MRKMKKEIKLAVAIKISHMKIKKEKKEYMRNYFSKRQNLLNQLTNRFEIRKCYLKM